MNKKFIIFLLAFICLTFIKEISTKAVEEEDENEDDIEKPIFSEKSGFFDDEFELKLSSKEGNEIYYTTDSSDPLNSETVKLYKKPIKIYDRSSEPNLYAEIGEDKNSPQYIGDYGGYKRPNYLLDKAMVIRAYIKTKDGQNSTVITHTYFVTTDNLAKYQDFTVVSLVTNPDDLFDPDKGLLVVGNDYIEEKNDIDPNDFTRLMQLMFKSNCFKEGEEWEKLTNMAIFENGNVTVQQNVAIKIRGFSTRMQAGKSFNIYAKKRFGKSTIKYAIFPENYDVNHDLIEEYKSFALRNVFSEERIKDELANILLYGREYQSISTTKKCVLFLNGEYWGFYIMIEKFSENYIASHFDIPKERVSLIKEGELSNGEEYELALYNNFFYEYSRRDVTSQLTYEEISNFVDLDSLIEHYVTGIYLGTWDWPAHNDGVWRYNGEKIEDKPYTDGKWRYISFDFDYSMGASFPMWGEIEQQEPYEIDNLKGLEMRRNVPTILFLPLLNNEDFRNKYINRFCDFMNDVLNLDRIDPIIDDYKDNYLDMLANGKLRWKGYEYSNEKEAFANYKIIFSKILDDIRTFFTERPKYAIQHMIDYLNLEEELKKITISIEGKGKIKINSITPEIKNGKWVGQYFSNIPITITAIPSNKSKFKGWSGGFSSDEKTIEIELTKDTKITAEFE